MNNEKYHFYRCTNPDRAPQPYARGVIGYHNELVPMIVENLQLRYLGYKTEKELAERKKVGVRPSKAITTHYNGEGHRY